MIALILIIMANVYASVPLYWNHLTAVTERHEFYADHEIIEKPKDSWQLLFAVTYTDIELKQLKDCLFFRVPGQDEGILKLKTIFASEKCDLYILRPGDKEIKSIRSLQFSTSPERLTVEMTFPKYKNEKWDVKFLNRFEKPLPHVHLSSVEYKSPKIIFLAPKKNLANAPSMTFLKDHTLCHNISDACEELAPSVCSECREGWFEVPNGCAHGPKFCGYQNCGTKDLPACRRGMKWQRLRLSKFDCRTDSSFAYCSPGSKLVCEGSLAYCR